MTGPILGHLQARAGEKEVKSTGGVLQSCQRYDHAFCKCMIARPRELSITFAGFTRR